MRVITDIELRTMWCKNPDMEFEVEEDTIITPAAKDFVKDHGIKLYTSPKGKESSMGVYSTAVSGSSLLSFGDALPDGYVNEKPEHMTHLRGNVLVSKDAATIVFRGKLDSLEAKIIETQLIAHECNSSELVENLDELYTFVRAIMSADVKNELLVLSSLLGMDERLLRSVSQNVLSNFGFHHPIPSYLMGRECVALNSLRTAVRETEVAATAAFRSGTDCTRVDIVMALNRLSSCVYILFCRLLCKHNKDKNNE